MNTKRAVGVFAGRARLAVALQLAACLPRDELSVHSREWGVDASGGNAGESIDSPHPRDAGIDSGPDDSNGSSSPEPAPDAAAADGAPGPDAADTDGGPLVAPDASSDAAAGVLVSADAG